MKIAELATRAGVAPSAVRWYEQEGVLPAPARQPNGYRAYDEVDLARLRLVLSLRRRTRVVSRVCASNGVPWTSTSHRWWPSNARASPGSVPTSIGWRVSCSISR